VRVLETVSKQIHSHTQHSTHMLAHKRADVYAARCTPAGGSGCMRCSARFQSGGGGRIFRFVKATLSRFPTAFCARTMVERRIQRDRLIRRQHFYRGFGFYCLYNSFLPPFHANVVDETDDNVYFFSIGRSLQSAPWRVTRI